MRRPASLRSWLLAALATPLLCLAACEVRGDLSAGATPPTPPANAEFLDPAEGPREVMSGILHAKPAAREQAAAEYRDAWIKQPGWEGTVDQVTAEDGGYAVRMLYHEATIIGGGVWVVALVPGELPAGVERHAVVRYQGRIVDVQFNQGGVAARIILDGVTILEARPGN